MTIQQYIDAARRPGLYTAEQIQSAFQHWDLRAHLSGDEDVAMVARIWRRKCAEALESMGG